MNNQAGAIFGLFFCVLMLFVSPKISSNNEISRKFAHITISNYWLIANSLIDSLLYALVTPAAMIVLMVMSYKYTIFQGVERKNQKRSFGTIFYFLGMFILIVISFNKFNSTIPLGIFFMPLGYGDGFAAIVGKKINCGVFYIFGHKKTIVGSIAMLLISFSINLLYRGLYSLEVPIIGIILISLIATVIEAVSVNGTDNFTIPVLTYFIIGNFIF